MNGFLLVISLLALLICVLILMVSMESKAIAVVLAIISTVIIYWLIEEYRDKDIGKPTALDVYRDNTTLQITYQDSIPIDSVVVFKTIKNK